jgi:Na+/proline symporter
MATPELAFCDLARSQNPGAICTHMPEKYHQEDSFFGGKAPLSKASGYIIVIGMGLGMTLLAAILTHLEVAYTRSGAISSEFFNTAGRSVKTGLTASVIVSQWTWAATLLQSSNVAWNYGISGPFWYASGATIQVLLFGILAIEIKRKCPTAHTMCEIVKARWPEAHSTFLFFGFSANLIVTSMLILGGGATINALTGMHTILASFLIPISVIPYTMYGGLKATFLASYIHTSIIFVVLLMMIYTIYVSEFSSNQIWTMIKETSSYTEEECRHIFSEDFVQETGSPTYKVWSALPNKDKNTPPPSELFLYREEKSKLAECLDADDCTKQFACGGVVGNKGMDTDTGSYLTMISLEGLKFGIINIVGNFGTVFCDQSYWQSAIAAKPASAHKGYMLGGMVWFAIPFSLASSLGVASTAIQLPISATEAGAGLVPPAVAVHLLGSGGGWAIAIMLFMAIISTGSAEAIAVSSLISYDIYKPYFNPKANGDDVIRVSRIVIPIYCVLAGALATVLWAIGIGLGWVYGFMGIHIGCAVSPLWFCLTDSRVSAKAAIAAAWAGCISGYVAWICTCAGLGDPLDRFGLGTLSSMLAGNVFSIGISWFICMGQALVAPDDYDWQSLKEIALLDDDQSGLDAEDLSEEKLVPALDWIKRVGWSTTFVLIVLWPALSTPAGVFTKTYFAFWIFVVIAWGFFASVIIVGLPIYESFGEIAVITRALTGLGGGASKDEIALSERGGKSVEA